jgi:hypothetical protein
MIPQPSIAGVARTSAPGDFRAPATKTDAYAFLDSYPRLRHGRRRSLHQRFGTAMRPIKSGPKMKRARNMAKGQPRC